jgi:hypothetical protein
MRFCVIGVPSTAAIRGSGGIVSSFRPICIAALTVAVAGFVAGAAAAQTTIVIDRSGKPYLAGLRPPHEQHKPAHAANNVSAQRKATTKMARPETKRRPIVGANTKPHRPARLAEKINSRVAWPNAEPAAADDRASSQTVLQFATEDTEPAPAATARPTMPTPSAAKTAPPAKIAATNERNSVDPTPVDKPSPAASTPAQSGLKPWHQARCALSCRHQSRPPSLHQHPKISRKMSRWRAATLRPRRCWRRLPARSLPASLAG